LSETLNKQDVNKAIVVMGTTVATGTFLVYGISSIFAAIGAFRITFYVATGIMLIVAAVWFFAYPALVNPLQAERKQEEIQTAQTSTNTSIAYSYVGLLIGMLAFFAIANNFIKDGLTSWTPDILSAVYNTPGWLSILLTLLLPVMAIFGTVVAMRVYKAVKDFVGTCVVLYSGSAILIGLVIVFLSTSAMPVTIACFALVSCLMAGVNNVITSLVPLKLKIKMNAGKLAGILNGFCYLGSTLSAYGLGTIADAFGWSAVFYTLLGVCLFVLLLGGAYLAFRITKKEK
jgi:OPA family glycerol-3-phosphate transporter-like MFS transporter